MKARPLSRRALAFSLAWAAFMLVLLILARPCV